MTLSLRPYQEDALSRLRGSLAQGKRRPLLVMPTGSGKTVVASKLIANAHAKRRKVMFVAPRRELIYQTSAKLSEVGVDHGIIMAGERGFAMHDVQVACIPTLHARAFQRGLIDLPKADVVMVDEAHIGVGGMAQDLILKYAEMGAYVVGLTATPARTDGRGLGEIYDDLVLGPSVRELTDMGHLVPARYYVGVSADLAGVPVQLGEYQQTALAERVDQPKLVGDIVSNWARLARGRQTFVFAVNIAHSKHLADEFRAIGVRAEHIDGQTELDERKGIMARLRSGEIEVLVNCQVMTYGVDFPPVSAVVLACPTKSVSKYLQMVGRGLRTHPGKIDCLVLDHAMACHELGFADDDFPWSLDGTEKVQERKERDKKEPKEITCPACQYTFRARPVCPWCGHEMRSEHKHAIEVREAELREMERGKVARFDKATFFAELKWYARSHGKQEGWASHKFREVFGVWPNKYKHVAPIKPSPETESWIRSRNIAYAKARQKVEAPAKEHKSEPFDPWAALDRIQKGAA
jgi:superfamily II DNA or RNA helicase